MDEKSFSKSRYTHRDYETTKEDLLSIVPSLTQKWTDFSEASPGVVYIKLLSMITDNLSYNFDKGALELYKSTVTQRKNCAKILRLLGYKMHWYRSARVIARLSVDPAKNVNTQGGLSVTSYVTQIVAGDKIYTMLEPKDKLSNPVIGETLSYTLGNGESREFNFIEGTVASFFVNKDSVVDNKIPISETAIDESLIWMKDGNTIKGKFVDDITLNTDPYNFCFELCIDDYDSPYLKLSPGWESIIQNSSFAVYYIKSTGSSGNVGDNTFGNILNSDGNSSNMLITNRSNFTESFYGKPGADPETVEEAVAESSKYVFTFDTLVTQSDFEKACLRVDGVTKARLLDQTLLDQKGITDINKIINSMRDGSSLTLPLSAGTILLYIIYGNLNNNEYCSSVTGTFIPENDITLRCDYLRTENRDIAMSFISGHYYPYKPSEATTNKIKEYIDDKKVITVAEKFTTSRIYPYVVNGTVYLYDPLSPMEVLSIANTIDEKLSKVLNEDNMSFSSLPDMMSVIECIQDADSHIRYFSSGMFNPIEFILKDTTEEEMLSPVAMTTYAGLAWKKDNASEDGFNFSNHFTFNKETMSFGLKYTPVTEGGLFVADAPLTILRAPESEHPFKYEDITDINIPANKVGVVECKNIAQLNTLVHHLNHDAMISYVNPGETQGVV